MGDDSTSMYLKESDMERFEQLKEEKYGIAHESVPNRVWLNELMNSWELQNTED